jgi:chitodextrinase
MDSTPATQPAIQAPSQAKVGEIVTFSASQSVCANQCVAYSWNMTDGSVYNAVTIQHVYQTPAAYIVTLTVTDSTSVQSTVVKQIAIKK